MTRLRPGTPSHRSRADLRQHSRGHWTTDLTRLAGRGAVRRGTCRVLCGLWYEGSHHRGQPETSSVCELRLSGTGPSVSFRFRVQSRRR
eukprot:2927140-Prymnesium_polylepis.1